MSDYIYITRGFLSHDFIIFTLFRPDDLLKEKKFIVSVSALDKLLKVCSACDRTADYEQLQEEDLSSDALTAYTTEHGRPRQRSATHMPSTSSCVVLCYLLEHQRQRFCLCLKECLFKCHAMTPTCRYRQTIFLV